MGAIQTDNLQADSITDKAGTGAPNFSQGLQIAGGTIVGKNKTQTKTLAADRSTDGTMTDLTFNGLTIGRLYRVTHQALFATISGDNVLSQIVHDGVVRAQISSGAGTSTTNVGVAGVALFLATATTVTFEAVSITAGSLIRGNGDLVETWASIEELNDYDVTTDFT